MSWSSARQVPRDTGGSRLEASEKVNLALTGQVFGPAVTRELKDGTNKLRGQAAAKPAAAARPRELQQQPAAPAAAAGPSGSAVPEELRPLLQSEAFLLGCRVLNKVIQNLGKLLLLFCSLSSHGARSACRPHGWHRLSPSSTRPG